MRDFAAKTRVYAATGTHFGTRLLTTIIKLPLEHNGIRDQQEELLASTVGDTLEKSDFALTVKHQFVLVALMCQPVASLRSVMLDTKSAQVSQ